MHVLTRKEKESGSETNFYLQGLVSNELKSVNFWAPGTKTPTATGYKYYTFDIS